MQSSEFLKRLKRWSATQRRLRLDAAIILTPVNRLYFTGLQASNGLLLTRSNHPPTLFTDFRYLTAARSGAAWLTTHELWRTTDELERLSTIGQAWRCVGYEGNITAARWLQLKEALPQIEWVNISSAIGELRAVKSRHEQRLMRGAIAANECLFTELIKNHLHSGATERTLVKVIRRLADELGEGEAFDSIVCVGRNAAECHHQPDDTPWHPDKPLLLDLGVKLADYHSDKTLSLPARRPSKSWRAIYQLVRQANLAAIAAIRPGVACCDIDAIARNVIAKAGYGSYFGHALGHSLGLEVHETPSFSATCTTLLKPGMILTVEPGVYLPGRLGIRLEDVVLVTLHGCEVLTCPPPALN